jgi:PAS domain S-box-containing protein
MLDEATVLLACRRLVLAVRGCALVLIDGRGRIEVWNPGAERLFGHRKEEVEGCPLATVGAAAEDEGAWPAWPEPGADPVEQERWLFRKDGGRWRAEVFYSRIEEGGGLAMLARDVTGRSRKEAELSERLARAEEGRRQAEQAAQMRDDLLGTLSHELRTPLTAIAGWAHLLRTGTLDEAGRARAVEVIERNARLQAVMTTDMLDISRIMAGRLRLDLALVDPVPIVEEAVSAARDEGRAKRMSIEMVLDPVGGCVRADAGRLRQIVGTLLACAIKLAPEGSHVGLTLRGTEKEVEIAVESAQARLAPEALPHVFDRVGRGARAGEHGLALAIVRHLVEIHSGSVSAASRGPDEGVTLTVRLPRVVEGESGP